jgi:hypothetical protein
MPSSRLHAGVCRRVVAGTMSYLHIEGEVGVVEAQREVVLGVLVLPTSPSHVAVRVASLTVDIELGVTRAAAEIPALSKATVCCRSCTVPSTTSKTRVTVLCQHGLDPLDDSPRDGKPKSPRSPNRSKPSTGYPRASRRRRRGPDPTTAAKEARAESSRIQPSSRPGSSMSARFFDNIGRGRRRF